MRPLLLPRLSALGVIVAVHFLEFGTNHALVRLGLRRVAAFGRSRALLGLVHGLAELHGRLRQGVGLGLDVFGVFALVGGLQRSGGVLDGGLLGRADLVAMLGQGLFRAVDGGVGLVLGLDQLLAPLVLGGVRLGVLDHLLDVGVRQAAVGLDADRHLLVGRLVLGGHMHDAVGVDVVGVFFLWFVV